MYRHIERKQSKNEHGGVKQEGGGTSSHFPPTKTHTHSARSPSKGTTAIEMNKK